MPPLHLFGRQWRMGSDDLVCPALAELAIRLAWVGVVGAVLVFHVRETHTLQCLGAEYEETTYYLALTLGILLTVCLNMALLAVHSARGSLSDAGPRLWVPALLYANVFLTALELLWTALGTYFTVHDYLSCKEEVQARTAIVAVLVVIGLSYILLGVKLTTAALSWRPSASVAQAINYRSLRCILPCARGEGHIQAFKDIASLLGKILHDKDLVPSDLLAGLLLLSQKHRVSSLESRERPVTLVEAGTVSVSVVNGVAGLGLARVPDTAPAWGRVHHFYPFASAAYGYWWYVAQAPCSHSCGLRTFLSWPCARCLGAGPKYSVQGDGPFHVNSAAMRAVLQIPPEDIMCVDNRNNLQEVPFFLVIDRTSQSLVISIRGTLSLADMLTDLRGEPCSMAAACPEVQLPAEWQAHEGMCHSARYVFRRVEGAGREPGLLADALQQTNYKEVVVTGHSLGAGTAAILALLLRARHPELTVSCLAYSPPGGLLCAAAARESEQFCVSVVMGDDVIPRTSLHNIRALSASISRICRSCRLPKYKLFGYGLLGCCCPPHVDLEAEVQRQFSSYPSSPSGSPPSSSRGLVSPACGHPLAEAPDMLPPGRLLHVTRDEHSVNGYRVAEVASDTFDEILISPRMLADHMPNYLGQVFSSLSETAAVEPLVV